MSPVIDSIEHVNSRTKEGTYIFIAYSVRNRPYTCKLIDKFYLVMILTNPLQIYMKKCSNFHMETRF